MKTAICILLATLQFYLAAAQTNIISNGGFELYKDCPFQAGLINNAEGWYNSSLGTPDLYNNCNGAIDNPGSVPNNDFGFQFPKEGNGYSGIYIQISTSDNKEYLTARFVTELEKDSMYHFSIYCSLADVIYENYTYDIANGNPAWLSVYGTHNIGAYFSADSIYQNSWEPLAVIPQIQNPITNPINSFTDWVKVEGTYKATGGEKYIYIGNFNNYEATVLDTLYIGENPEPWVYFYIDDVSLIKIPSPDTGKVVSEEIIIYPNPAQDFVSVNLPKSINQAQLSIYNITGQLVLQKQIIQYNQQVPIYELVNGVYIFVIQNEDRVTGRQKVLVAR